MNLPRLLRTFLPPLQLFSDDLKVNHTSINTNATLIVYIRPSSGAEVAG